MTIWNDRPINCVAVRLMKEVANEVHTKMGMRNRVIPGARILKMVTMMFSEPKIDERPNMYTPRKRTASQEALYH